MNYTLVITDNENGSEDVCTLAEFIMHNGDDAALCARVNALCIGEQILVGGGGAGAFYITRTA